MYLADPNLASRLKLYWLGTDNALRAAQVAMLLIVVVTAFRLWFCTHYELVPDEAYYWLWSKHPDICYRDKGPAIAWLITLGTWLGGDTVFGVRWLGVLLSAATGWQIFRLGQRLYGEKVGLLAVAATIVIPMYAVGSVLMTIDSISVFFWAWGANLCWEALHSRETAAWAYLGVVIGCGVLAKFTNAIQLFSPLLWMTWQKDSKTYPWFQILVLVTSFLVVSSPLISWNVANGWPNYSALHSRSGLADGFSIHPSHLLSFILEQAISISPPLYFALIIAIAGTLVSTKDDREIFLLSDFLPIYTCFLFFSLNVTGKANWTAPALIPGVVLAVHYWSNSGISFRRWAAIPLALAALETAALHETSWMNLAPERDPLRRARGWVSLAAHVQQWRDVLNPDLIVGNHYSQASELAFYLRDHPTTFTPASNHIENQFHLWPGYFVTPRTMMLYVTDSPDDGVPLAVTGQFRQVQLREDFFSSSAGRPVRRFQIYECSNR